MVTAQLQHHGHPAGSAQGWYLYGITRSGSLYSLADALDTPSLQLIEYDGLAAVVSAVDTADFTPDALQHRLRSAADLEQMVRSHHDVIDAIHLRGAVLPAKFGTVFPRASDVTATLRSARDTLRRQLDRLDGCDEWAVHLYADRASIRERIASADPTIRRLREQCATARPGRAFFLERQLRDELEGATQEALVGLAQHTFDQLAGDAVAAQMNPPVPSVDADGETEILRAAFLVSREGVRFEERIAALDAVEGTRCEYTGPWPPYSFAMLEGEAE